MDAQLKHELTSNNGKLIVLQDYDLRIVFDDYDRTKVQVTFFKKTKNQLQTHPEKFSDDDIDILVQDLEDLSDWRHYRILRNKMNSKVSKTPPIPL